MSTGSTVLLVSRSASSRGGVEVGHVENESVVDIAGLQAVERLLHVRRREDLDVCDDAAFGAESQEFCRLRDSAGSGCGQLLATVDEFEQPAADDERVSQ